MINGIAQTYCFALAQYHVRDYYNEFLALIKDGGSENFKPLAVIHHLVSGLKAFFTQNTYETINTMREACGGAGFSAYSGIPYLQGDQAAKVAYEGDNTVMLQQSAKYIITNVSKNKTLSDPFLSYLSNLLDQFSKPLRPKSADYSNIQAIDDALRIRSAYFIYRTIHLGLLKTKESGEYSSKQLMNEVYQQE